MTADASKDAAASQHESLADIERVANEIRDTILGHERIAIVTHANPDADAVASALAMRAVCEHLGRTPIVTVAGDGQVPDNLMFLNNILVLTANADKSIRTATLVIYVDCAEETRTGPLFEAHEEFLAGHPSTINIDHHVTNTRFARLNLVIPQAAATAEIIELLREHLEVPVSSELATAMLAGIYGDTLGLRTPSTTPSTMRVAASLVEAGAEIDIVVDWLFRVKPFSAVKLWAEALSSADWSGPLIWTCIDRPMLDRTHSAPSEAEGLINFLAGTIGARAAALAYEETNGWRVSLRSVYDDVDVSEIAKSYGGGGHPRAAGLRLPPGREALDTFISDVGSLIASLPTNSDDGTSS